MTNPRTGTVVPRAGNRHPNCKPVQIVGSGLPVFDDLPPSGVTPSKRAQHAELELLTQDFLANGGEIQRLQSESECTLRYPAFDYLAAESGSYA